MEKAVQRDIRAVLDGARGAIKGQRYSYLHGLSDHIIHSMSIYQQEEIVDTAIVIYTLDKIFEKEIYLEHKDMPAFRKKVIDLLSQAKSAVYMEDLKVYRAQIKKILSLIKQFTGELQLYIEDLLDFAKIKKGSRLYEHGISLGQAAEVLGISKWELMEYAGKTSISERRIPTITPKKRLEFIKKLFKFKK